MSARHFAAVALLFVLGACRHSQPAGDQKDFTAAALQASEALRFFAANHPGRTILKYSEADFDDDQRQDLIIIYQRAKDDNRMCVIRHGDTGFTESNSLPAPVADQLIRLKDIDGKPPLEFIVQGRKGAKVGYAIFRIEQGVLVDLFGEGMEDCC